MTLKDLSDIRDELLRNKLSSGGSENERSGYVNAVLDFWSKGKSLLESEVSHG